MTADDAQIKPTTGILSIGHAVVGAELRSPQSFVIQCREKIRDLDGVLKVDDKIVFPVPAGISLFPGETTNILRKALQEGLYSLIQSTR